MSWEQAIDVVSPHIVKIATPSGYGTGFLAFYNHDHTWCGIATAAHVVSHADEWQEPLRITPHTAENSFFVKPEERVIFVDHATDSAIVLLFKSDLGLPEVPIALLPMSSPCGIGMDVGWLGYPAIEQHTLCFFSGAVSARLEAGKAYLIDGVAINGVSGGPVFHCTTPDNPLIIGTISAYHANRATGEALPGLLRAQDVTHFHGIATQIRSIDDAQQKKRSFDEAKQQEVSQQELGTTAAEPAPDIE